jgi:tRNA A37 threonylcarbamoyladenosine biosynthesis protein TsaE
MYRSVATCSSIVHMDAYLIGDSTQDRVNFLEMLLHCCDLSGQVMKTEIAVEWGKRIMREFRNQVSK